MNLLMDTLGVCQGDSGYVEIKHQFENNVSITWTTPEGIITNTKKVRANKEGKYFVKVSAPQFYSMMDSTGVRIDARAKLLLRDTSLCKGKTLALDARNSGMHYFWNTFETTQKITITNPGRYWVVISNGSCISIDTVYVKQIQGNGVQVPNEAIFCLNDEIKVISIKIAPGTKVLWSTGATSASTYAFKEGNYWVRTETKNCGVQLDTIKVKLKVCECEMMVPNSFTPNEDNRNDFFFPVMQCEYSYYTITITDRWTNTVFSSNNINAKWDGRFKGNLCPEDIYVYKIESIEKGSEKRLVRNGHISLFR